jgi:lactoylglutathione lyase
MNFVFDHISRATPNLERTVAFYKAFGCNEQKRVRSDEQGLTRVVLSLPGSETFLQLIAFDDAHFTAPGETWADHLKFITSDFDQSLEGLVRAGGIVTREPYRLPGRATRIAFVADPDGHQLELVEKTV